MVFIPSLTDNTPVHISSKKLEGNTTTADCIVTKFAKGTRVHTIKGSSMEEYVATRGVRISEMTFGTNSTMCEGTTITDKMAMTIITRWYLENIYPLLHETLDGFSDSEEDKIAGFVFWMFHPEHKFIELTNWSRCRREDLWELRVGLARSRIKKGESFNSVMEC